MTCDIESSQAQIILDVNDFPKSTAGESYNVVFKIPLHLNGIFDHEVCYLYLQVDNVMLSNQGKQKALTTASLTLARLI